VRNLLMSVDPYMRGRMDDRKSYVPPFQVGHALEGGAIGEVTHFRSEYLMSNYLQPDLDFSWRLDKKIAGTGTFGDLGAHHIDLARFLVGEISEVAAANGYDVAE